MAKGKGGIRKSFTDYMNNDDNDGLEVADFVKNHVEGNERLYRYMITRSGYLHILSWLRGDLE